MQIVIRTATQNDLEWVNAQYESISFLPSNLNNENVVIAIVDNTTAGMGRLKKIDNESAELGGIYVLPQCRNLGIARRIVSKLLIIGEAYHNIYCLPYIHLEQFYGSFGFKAADSPEEVPELINKKHNWCKSTYKEEVLLYIRKKTQ